MAKNKVRRLLTKLAVSAMSLAATLLSLEIGIRLFDPQEPAFWDSSAFRRMHSNPSFLENIPGSRANFTGVPVAINSLGLRGDEIRIPKPAGTIRILSVGDSIAFGYGIRLEDSYGQVLERRLNDNGHGIHYEVLNGGIIGGSLTDYQHFLEQKASQLDPDVVIVGITLNDIFVYSDAGSVSTVGARWRGKRSPWLRRISHFLLRHSHLYMFCYSRIKSILYRAGILDINTVRGLNFMTLTAPTPYQQRAWESSLSKLSQIVTFCRDHRYRILAVVFPAQMQLSSSDLKYYGKQYHLRLDELALSGEPQRRLKEFGTQRDVTVVDLLPAYRQHASEDLYLRKRQIPADPIHPSVRGNELAADALLSALSSEIRQPGNRTRK